MLYLFNKFRVNLDHPFSVLRCFLFTYSNFNWSNYVLSLDGPIPIINGRMALPNDSIPVGFNRFADLQAKIRTARECRLDARVCERPRSFGNFLMRLCNIQDPVDPQNNLGISVSPQFMQLLTHALDSGSKHLESLMHMASAVPKTIFTLTSRNASHASTGALMSKSSCTATGHEYDGSSSPAIAFLREFFSYSSAVYLSATEVRADLKDHPLQLYDAAEAAEVRGNPSETSLECDLQTIWERLRVAQEIASLNDESFDRFLKLTQRGAKESSRPEPMPVLPEDSAAAYADDSADENFQNENSQNGSPSECQSRSKRKSKRRSRAKRKKGGRIACSSVGEGPGSSEATSREDWDDDIENSSTGTIVPPVALSEARISEDAAAAGCIGTTDLSGKTETNAPGDSNSTGAHSVCQSRPVVDENKIPKVPVEFYSLSVLRSLSFDLFQYKKTEEADHRKSYTDSFFEARKAGIKRLAVGDKRVSNGAFINTCNADEFLGEYSKSYSPQPSTKPSCCAPSTVDFTEFFSDDKGGLCQRKLGAGLVMCSFFLFCLSALFYGLACMFLERYVFMNGAYGGMLMDDIPVTLNERSPVKVPTAIQWAKAGDDVSIENCSGVGWWRRGDDNPLTLGSKYFLGKMNSSLEGMYECRVDGGGLRWPLSQVHLRLAVPPTIRSKPTYSDLEIGKPFLVSLSADGFPSPSYQWYQNGLPLHTERSNKLYFAAVELRHSGTYSCLIQNVAGSVIWLEATLSVRGEG